MSFSAAPVFVYVYVRMKIRATSFSLLSRIISITLSTHSSLSRSFFSITSKLLLQTLIKNQYTPRARSSLPSLPFYILQQDCKTSTVEGERKNRCIHIYVYKLGSREGYTIIPQQRERERERAPPIISERHKQLRHLCCKTTNSSCKDQRRSPFPAAQSRMLGTWLPAAQSCRFTNYLHQNPLPRTRVRQIHCIVSHSHLRIKGEIFIDLRYKIRVTSLRIFVRAAEKREGYTACATRR